MYFEDERKKEIDRNEPENWQDYEKDRTTGINKFEPEGVMDGVVSNKRMNDRYIPNKRGC